MAIKVGGIIASRTNKVPGTAPIAGMINVAAFKNTLNNSIGTNWMEYYGWVKPWDDSTINAYVDQLCGDADVKVIVVTGTTIGEKVKAERDTQANKPWIVMATDDGNWMERFPDTPGDPNYYVTQKITGSTSGYSTRLTGSGSDNGKTITYFRAKDLKQAIGSTAQIGVVRGDPSLTAPANSYSEQERANQLAAVADGVGVAVVSLPIIEVGFDNAGNVTFTPNQPQAGVNGLIVLGDSVTFLARQEIADTILYGQGNWLNIQLSSGPHKAFLAAGLSTTDGPDMSGRHKKVVGLYQRAAGYVKQILQSPTANPDAPYVPKNRGDFEKF